MIKRVAIFTDHADPLAPIGAGYMGGENVYVLELTRALSRLGWHTDVYTRASSLKTTHIAKVSQDARVIRLKAGPVSFVPRDKLFTYMPEYVESFLKFQKENKLEYLLIHGNYYFSGWAALQSAKVLGIPFVNTFHTLGIVRHNFLKDTDPSPHERIAIEKEIMTADNRIIATSPQMRDEMIRLYGTNPKKITVIPGGVNLNRFQPTPQLLARRVLHFSINRLIALYVGRIERRKGIDTLLEAVAELARLMPDKRPIMRCYIAGGNPKGHKSKVMEPSELKEWERLQGIVDKLGIKDIVRFLGGINRELLTFYYAAADVTVVPSYYEPFGLVPLESMASGTPVVASRVGGIQWTIRDGKSGYLVEPGNAKAFAERIRYLMTHATAHKLLRENGIERVKLFSWDNIADQMSDLYQDVVIDYFYRKAFHLANGNGEVKVHNKSPEKPITPQHGAATG